MTGTLPDLAPDLRAVLERHADRLDLDLIERALRFSASAHRGQKRMSGEDFVSHSIGVALILAEQLLDSTTIAALCDGTIGYICTADAYQVGGYEPNASVLREGEGERVADAIVALASPAVAA